MNTVNNFVLKFWGVRGSTSTDDIEIGGQTTCVQLTIGGKLLILDAGSGIRKLGDELMARLCAGEKIEAHLIFSHLHRDHWEGLGFFAPLFHPNFTCHMWSRKGLQRMLRKKIFDNDTFPVTPEMLRAKIEFHLVDERGVYVIPTDSGENIIIEARLLNHPGGCFGYRVQFANKVVSLLYDHEEISAAKRGDEEAERLERNIIELCTGANLVVTECQYTDAMFQVGWGHERVGHLIEVLKLALPLSVITTHHDPKSSSAQVRSIATAVQAGSGIPTTFAFQGMEVAL